MHCVSLILQLGMSHAHTSLPSTRLQVALDAATARLRAVRDCLKTPGVRPEFEELAAGKSAPRPLVQLVYALELLWPKVGLDL